MARKKSEKNLKPLINVKASQVLNSVAYTGNIRVKVMKGNRECYSRSFHNAGRWPLFNFLALCLNQEYTTADAFRPKFIDLFDVEDVTVVPALEDITEQSLSSWFQISTRVSTNTYPYLSNPEIKLEEGAIGGASITYKFNIPFTQLETTTGGTIRQITAVCLYSSDNKGKFQNPSCFFFVTENDGKTITNLLDKLSLSQLTDATTYKNEYSLYIEWELSISNPVRNN